MFGNIWRFTALFIVCLVVASATAEAQTDPMAGPVVTSVKGWTALNGERFFPLLWEASTPCPDSALVDDVLSMGVNVIEHHDVGCDGNLSPEALHEALDGRVLWWERTPAFEQLLQGLPELVDWRVPMTFYVDGEVLLTCSDMSTTRMFNEILRRSRSQSVIYQILVREKLTPSYISCLNGPRMAALFWTAVLAGAKGISYTTDLPWSRVHFAVNSGVVAQAKKQAQQMRVIQPALMSPAVGIRRKGPATVKVVARRYKGVTYVIAVNTGNTTAKVSFTVNRMAGRKANVLWERRSIRVVRRTITDKFAPLAVHIYRVKK